MGIKTLKTVAFTNFGKRFFIYIQAVLQCHSCLSTPQHPPFFLICRISSFSGNVQDSDPDYLFSSSLVPLWQCFLTRPQQLGRSKQKRTRKRHVRLSSARGRQITSDNSHTKTFLQVRDRTTRHYLWLHFCSKECSSHNLITKNTAQTY